MLKIFLQLLTIENMWVVNIEIEGGSINVRYERVYLD